MTFWTEEKTEALRKFWRYRPMLSATEIGEKLNCSKNAVLGKVHRLGLSARAVSSLGKSVMGRQRR